MRGSAEAAPESGESGLKLLLALASALAIALGALALVPNLIESRGGSRESYAAGALRTIATAQTIFRESDRNRNGVFEFGDLTALGQANLVDQVLSAGVKDGYRFTVVSGSDGTTDSEYVWWAAADPAIPGETGDRYFFTNQSGDIWYSYAAPIVPRTGTTKPVGARRIGER